MIEFDNSSCFMFGFLVSIDTKALFGMPKIR